MNKAFIEFPKIARKERSDLILVINELVERRKHEKTN